MADDLQALLTRLKELPAGVELLVLIPTGEPQTIGGLVVRTNETFRIASSLFAAPAAPAPPGDAPQPERYVVVAVDILNVRDTADKNARLLGTVRKGDTLAVKGDVVNGYVALSSRPGYVLASGLTGA